MIEELRGTSFQLEQVINSAAAPIKPYLSHIGRFLLVVTFLEDALRIVMQWAEQSRFMQHYRGLPAPLAHLFLLYNVSMMLTGSMMALLRLRTPIACAILGSVVVIQTLGYGLMLHLSFILRNFSLIGGLLLLMAEASARNSAGRKQGRGQLFPGLPDISETERGTYMSLAGRVLLILLFGALSLQGKFSGFKIVLAIAALVSCVMVVVGFKARYSAVFLVAILSIANIFLNPWWQFTPDSAERDFVRYDFFQILSIVGGFLLLANSGPGELSLDEKKKSF